MRTALSHSLSESGLYAGQDGVILALAQEGSLTPGQIAQKLGVKAPTMTRTIGRMEAQGFVERSGDDEDGRVTLVKLTEAGLKSVDHINTSIADCGARAIEGLSARIFATLLNFSRQSTPIFNNLLKFLNAPSVFMGILKQVADFV